MLPQGDVVKDALEQLQNLKEDHAIELPPPSKSSDKQYHDSRFEIGAMLAGDREHG